MRVLLLIPHRLPPERHEAARAGRRPQADYDALASAIEAMPEGKADIMDYKSVDRSRSPLVWLVRRFFGEAAALALLGHFQGRGYDAVFSHSEIVGIPFALMSWFRRRRPGFVTNAYYLTGRRHVFWFKVCRLHRRMDRVVTLSPRQYEVGRDELGIPDTTLVLMECFGFVDTAFFRADSAEAVDERQICSTGLEYRDYGVIVRAMAQLPEVTLKIDPTSPWSRHSDEVETMALPPNVRVCRGEIGAARQLYAESAAVVIPLRDNPIGAGTTTIVEAMLSGKPVITTCSLDGRFSGRPDLISGENIILVAVGDGDGWRAAIDRVVNDRTFRMSVGAKGREWAERNAERRQWLDRMLMMLAAVASAEKQTRGSSPGSKQSRHDGRYVRL